MRSVIGIFNSENKAKEVINALKTSGINAENIQLMSKYAMLPDNEEPSALVDPNSNIFNLDHNGLDVPLGDEMAVTLKETFTNKLNRVLYNNINDIDIPTTLERAEKAGYVVVVETDSPEIFNKASEILKA